MKLILTAVVLAETLLGQEKYQLAIDKVEQRRIKKYRKLNAAAKKAIVGRDAFLRDWLVDCGNQGKSLQYDPFHEPTCLLKASAELPANSAKDDPNKPKQ